MSERVFNGWDCLEKWMSECKKTAQWAVFFESEKGQRTEFNFKYEFVERRSSVDPFQISFCPAQALNGDFGSRPVAVSESSLREQRR